MKEMNGIIEGRMVHYVLSASDVKRINDSRMANQKAAVGDEIVGFQKNVGNPVVSGQHVAMIIVKVFVNEFGIADHGVNGQCILDGYDQLWITSARFDETGAPGTWHWIEKV